MTTHGNLNQITRGVIRRIDGWIGAISNFVPYDTYLFLE